MQLHKSECMGEYDFDHIAYFAKKRFIDGRDTITLLTELLATAKTGREKEEVALVSSLGLEGNTIKELQMRCMYAGQCKTDAGQCRIGDCITKLKTMLAHELDKDAD